MVCSLLLCLLLAVRVNHLAGRSDYLLCVLADVYFRLLDLEGLDSAGKYTDADVPIVGVRTFGTSRAVIHYVERLVGHDTILRILSKMRVRLYHMLEPQALFLSSRFLTGDIWYACR